MSYKNDCRNCDHYHFTLSLDDDSPVMNTCSYATSEPVEYRCGCYNFIPADNLEYLEYMYAQKVGSK